ncbi:hypothetical protein [Lichenibacterium ramalinae]|uniref:Uncharacterized protein n=1 Tax=Lichenibacterium ramalinae TaxID=2316527 RepID=A0A4Q2R9K9_9HYPH|nr:hypothetical protein [Lichenibacterium ramalinae]RYB03574.1 hypothetical protein D3272_15580 [Lichenibacterium ramalinae]
MTSSRITQSRIDAYKTSMQSEYVGGVSDEVAIQALDEFDEAVARHLEITESCDIALTWDEAADEVDRQFQIERSAAVGRAMGAGYRASSHPVYLA